MFTAVAKEESKDDERPNLTLVQFPWRRLPNETPEAFEAWQYYIEDKPQGGSIASIANKLGKRKRLLEQWSVRHKWVERYALYQNHQQQLDEQEQRRASRDEARIWAERRARIRDKGFEVGEMLVKRAEMLLSLPVYDREIKRTVEGKDGQVIPTLTVLNFKQNPRDARLFLDTGIKLMRLSADLSTENFDLNTSEADLDNMDETQLTEFADKLAEMRAKQIEAKE